MNLTEDSLPLCKKGALPLRSFKWLNNIVNSLFDPLKEISSGNITYKKTVGETFILERL